MARQIAVKVKYELWVKPAEGDAMERVLESCDDFAAVADDDPTPDRGDGDVVTTAPEEAEPTTEAPKAPEPEEESSSSGGSVYYKNCDAVRAAGADPIHRGDPGYAKHLDGDGDGVGCE